MEKNGAYQNASTEKSSTGGGGVENASTDNETNQYDCARVENARKKKQVQMCKDGKCKYGKNEVEMLAQASTDGATIDGSRCERDITKHPNKRELKEITLK